MKFFKYIGISILGIWLIFASFITYRFFSNGWTRFQNKETKIKWQNNPIWYNEISYLETPFENRIESCQEEYMLEFIKLERQLQNKEVEVSKGNLNSEFISQFKTLYNTWPVGLQRFAEKYVSRIFIVKNLGSSGYTFTTDNNSFIIFMDERILSEKPNDWFNRTEGNNINPEEGQFQLKHIIESDSTNIPVVTFENILIHEIGHCVGVVKGMTPTFNKSFVFTNDLIFYKDCYKIANIELEKEPGLENNFDKLVYYSSKEKMTCEEYQTILDDLKASPFPTTYSTRSEFEFFAEYFYSYVHCKVQKKPFEYRVFRNDSLVKSLENGIVNQTNEPRYQLIEKLFNEL